MNKKIKKSVAMLLNTALLLAVFFFNLLSHPHKKNLTHLLLTVKFMA